MTTTTRAAIATGLLALTLTGCGAADAVTEPAAPITRTVTATPEPAVVVPPSCLEAIREARYVAGQFADAITSAATLPKLIGEAYQAGYGGGGLENVIRKLDASTKVQERVGRNVNSSADRFNAAADACSEAADQ